MYILRCTSKDPVKMSDACESCKDSKDKHRVEEGGDGGEAVGDDGDKVKEEEQQQQQQQEVASDKNVCRRARYLKPGKVSRPGLDIHSFNFSCSNCGKVYKYHGMLLKHYIYTHTGRQGEMRASRSGGTTGWDQGIKKEVMDDDDNMEGEETGRAATEVCNKMRTKTWNFMTEASSSPFKDRKLVGHDMSSFPCDVCEWNFEREDGYYRHRNWCDAEDPVKMRDACRSCKRNPDDPGACTISQCADCGKKYKYHGLLLKHYIFKHTHRYKHGTCHIVQLIH